MKYTRMFFTAIFETMTIVISMWLFFILVMALVFFIYYKTGFMMNPWLPIGLFFIYVLFKKDGVIETLIEENRNGKFD
ncbi:hypothetical protein [Vagococcus fluvialis]|uniref:hypothetical protein n=1 Tax=Vagococcus fluvialis TaxID=2738 RepID=UPI001D0BC1C0|nr:hypothetical protein [Vagococcus fluvialis]UDM79126.1 hypothetical protein K5K97_10465 [Vagococcus fluvialis]